MQLSRDLWHFSNLKKSSVPPQRSILSIPVQILSDPKSVKKVFVHTWYICSCYLPLPNERHLINLKPLNKPALSLCQCERASNTLVFPKKKMCKGQAGLTKNGHLQKCHDDHLWGAGAWCKPGAPGCKADILPGHKVATAPTTRQQTHGAHFQSRKRSPQPRPVFCVKFLEIYMGHGRTATNSHRIGWWENV